MDLLAPDWLGGCARDCWFEPTFHKHVGKLAAAMHFTRKTDLRSPDVQTLAHPALAFKAIRRLYPDYPLVATSPTNTSMVGLPSMSSMADRRCGNGR